MHDVYVFMTLPPPLRRLLPRLYLSQVTVNLSLFTPDQASTTFTEPSDRLNLETSSLWTALATVSTRVPSCPYWVEMSR